MKPTTSAVTNAKSSATGKKVLEAGQTKPTSPEAAKSQTPETQTPVEKDIPARLARFAAPVEEVRSGPTTQRP